MKRFLDLLCLLCLCALSALFTGCADGTADIESNLPMIRTGAAVAAGAYLDFGVQQDSTRIRLATQMNAAAATIASLSVGTFPSPDQMKADVLAAGGSQSDVKYAQFASSVSGLYAQWYPQIVKGDSKTAADLLNAVAGGIQDATDTYLTTPLTLSAPPAN